MDTFNYIEDILPLVAFATAVVMVLRLPYGEDQVVSRGAKGYLVASVGVYLAGTLWSVLKRIGVISADLDPLIYSVELLWAPFVLFAIYSLYSRQRLLEARAALREVRDTGDLMERVVEAAPAGILVLDPSGHVTFANEAARSLLELAEDPLRFTAGAPGWTVHVAERGRGRDGDRADLSQLVTSEPMSDVNVVVSWPDGRRRRLVASTAPAVSPSGEVTGAVVSFMESEPWLKPRT